MPAPRGAPVVDEASPPSVPPERSTAARVSHPSSRRSILIAHLGFALVLASAFLPLGLVAPAPLAMPPAGAGRVAEAGAQLTAMLPATILCALLLLARAPRAAAAIGAGWAVAVMLWAGLDRFAHAATGNSATQYAEYLAEPDLWHWAGGSRGIWNFAAARGGAVLACAVGALVLGALVARLLRTRAGGAWSTAVAVLWAAVLGSSLAAGRGAAPHATGG